MTLKLPDPADVERLTAADRWRAQAPGLDLQLDFAAPTLASSRREGSGGGIQLLRSSLKRLLSRWGSDENASRLATILNLDGTVGLLSINPVDRPVPLRALYFPTRAPLGYRRSSLSIRSIPSSCSATASSGTSRGRSVRSGNSTRLPRSRVTYLCFG